LFKKLALSIILLLSIAQPSLALQFKLRPGGVAARGEENSRKKTMHILALRIRFQREDSDDPNTTGNGWFDLSDNSKEERINPAPHDSTYFDRQLKALANYYKTVSKGNLSITYEVFPQGEDSSYLLSHPMAYYNPLTSQEATDKKLAEFFRDAISVADTSDTTLHFADYDAFVIFHAGVGGDVSFYYDPTPRDLPSAFFNLEDLRKYLGEGNPNYQGIAVDLSPNGETTYVQEGLWLPETENQEGYEIGLTGIFAKLFGHQLGLPNLYNTLDGSSGIGQWGLMDMGCWNVDGLIPAQPCAWSKVFLGWVKPLVVSNQDSVKIAASGLKSGRTEVVKVPINSQEYFLIENRQRDVYGDDTVCVWEGGVLTSVDEYDWGIPDSSITPGPGILIWHIDETIIEAKLADNLVNSDPLHRGVDLEEADGFQDIGHIIEGYYITYGMPEDAFYKGNKSKNYRNTFTPSTRPNTNSNSGACSHIYITDFSPRDSVMSFNVHIDYSQPGWPNYTGGSMGNASPLFGDLKYDVGHQEVITHTIDGKILAWKWDGTKVIPNSDSTYIVGASNETTWVSAAIFAEVEDSIFCPPALANLNRDPDLEIIAGTGRGKVYAWKPTDEDGDGRADTLFSVSLVNKIRSISVADVDSPQGRNEIIALTSYPIVLTPGGEILSAAPPVKGVTYSQELAFADVDSDGTSEIIAGLYDGTEGQVLVYDLNEGEKGTIHTNRDQIVTHLAAADINRDGIIDIVGTTSNGGVFAGKALGDSAAYWFYLTGDPYLSSPALGDIDGDGYLEIVLSGANKVYAFNYNGTLVTNFPITISRSQPLGPLNSSPALADVDGDGRIEIVVGSPERELLAFHSDGSEVKGWPLSCGGPVSSSPAFLDVDNDDSLEVMVGSDDGWLYMWRLPPEYDPEVIPWPMRDYDVAHTSWYQGIYPEIPPPTKPFFSPKLAYNWPNPFSEYTHIRYWLGEEAQVNIKIFDLAGNLIDQFSGDDDLFWNDVEWRGKNSHGKDVTSGVYLCRIEAKRGSQKKVAFVKMALVR